jgi:hypothetical protein
MNSKINVNSLKTLWISSFLILAGSCAHVQVPNVEKCGVLSHLEAGASCAETLTDKRRRMTYQEFRDWLEPGQDKGPALCQSSVDESKTKTALEQACRMLGNRCTYEMQAALGKYKRALRDLGVQ